jgi:hypothetical protein
MRLPFRCETAILLDGLAKATPFQAWHRQPVGRPMALTVALYSAHEQVMLTLRDNLLKSKRASWLGIRGRCMR